MRVLNMAGQVIGTMDHDPEGNAYHFKHEGSFFIYAYEWFWIDEEGNPQSKVESDQWGVKRNRNYLRMEYFYYLNTMAAEEIAVSLPGWKAIVPKRIIERPTL